MTERLTILVANPFAEATSGNDEVLLRLMSKIDSGLFEFIVALPGESPYADAYSELGARVEIVPMSILRRDLGFSYLWRYFTGFIPTIGRFVKLIRQYGVNVVHTNTTQILGAGAAARLMGKPSIYHVHSMSIEKPEWVGKVMAFWIRLTADCLLSNSYASGDVFVRRGFSAERLAVITNPVDLSLYDRPGAREEVRRELGITDEPLIGFVGRIAQIKGIEHFIDAARILVKDFPDARFVVVGGAAVPADLQYLDRLKRQVECNSLTDCVQFTGHRNDIPRVMSALDALVLPSSCEGFGLVLIEAFAAGAPVIGSNVGGVMEIIDEGENGFLVPYADPEAIAVAMAKLISDPERARQMGQAGRSKVERLYCANRLAKVLEDIYISLATDKRRPISI